VDRHPWLATSFESPLETGCKSLHSSQQTEKKVNEKKDPTLDENLSTHL
jgi:hypothetical protein